MNIVLFAALLYVLMGFVAFLVYGEDKRRARLGRHRIPEQTLHTLELLFGWFGALMAQQVYRHKTRKQPFQMVFWAIGVLHFLVLGVLAFQLFSS
ncbi:DUF1294 domain-containing protein [Deinococcus cellulosilyticus]|nr:DUF1294 domain-containing protein [Deinococcus cellulosilyticus]